MMPYLPSQNLHTNFELWAEKVFMDQHIKNTLFKNLFTEMSLGYKFQHTIIYGIIILISNKEGKVLVSFNVISTSNVF